MKQLQYTSSSADTKVMYNINYIMLTNPTSRRLFQNSDNGNMLC